MYKLVISDDEGKTIIVPLVRDLITVGRQDGNTIRLTERNVSRAHARFVRDTSGYRIEDLDSYNGITVNGVRIEKTAELKDGDRVGVGDYVIALRAEASTGPSVTRAPGRGSAPQGYGAPPPARLVMISAPAPGAEFSMTKSAVSIGRLEELDLCISHRSISREHARVTQKAGGFEIEDLRSANGVRVNGASIKRSTLRSGDLVELGQVRFRFVGQGEPYTYDPAEEQAALLVPSKTRPGKQTVWALVGAAALAGGVLAFCQDGSKQAGAAMSKDTPPPAQPVTSAALEPSTEELPDQAQLGALLETCKQNLENGAYAEALRAADQALAMPGAGDEFTACKRDVNDAMRARSAYEQGARALAENKLEDAYFLFAGIPDDHSFRQKPEVKTTTERVAQERLVKARKLLRSDPKETRELATSVLDMQDAPKAARDEAAQLVALASAPVAMAEPSTTPTSTSTPNPKPKSVVSAQNSDEDPAKTARNCLARGDQRCVVRALEGKAENAQELALLIETYRALGETKKAVKHMETFVARYASARQTPQYRQFIAKHEP